MEQKRNTKTKQKARFISYIFFEVLFQNLKKQNIRAGGGERAKEKWRRRTTAAAESKYQI